MSVSTATKSTKDATQHASGSAPDGIKKWAAIAAALVAFQLGAIAVVETALYLAGIGEEEISLWDSKLGFKHRQNKRVTWRREGYAQSYLGPDGLREQGVSLAKPSGTYRIALIGDSLTEGLQEPLENTFGKMLEKRLTEQTGRPVEVINFGIFGYSTVQEYLFLNQRVLKYKPDMVVLCYNTRDMAETLETWAPKGTNQVGLRPYAIKENNTPLEISSAPIMNEARRPWSKFFLNLDWLKQHSRIWGFFSQNKPRLALHNPLVEGASALFTKPSRGLAAFADPGTGGQSFKIKFFEDKADSKTALRLVSDKPVVPAAVHDNSPQRLHYLKTLDQTFAALLERMNQDCASAGSRLLLAALPGRSDLLPIPGARPPLFNVSYTDELQFVKKNCAEQGVDFIDCHTAATRSEKKKLEELFYVLHFTRHGHRFVADLLQPQLAKQIIETD